MQILNEFFYNILKTEKSTFLIYLNEILNLNINESEFIMSINKYKLPYIRKNNDFIFNNLVVNFVVPDKFSLFEDNFCLLPINSKYYLYLNKDINTNFIKINKENNYLYNKLFKYCLCKDKNTLIPLKRI